MFCVRQNPEHSTPSLEGGRGVRELQDEGRSLVISGCFAYGKIPNIPTPSLEGGRGVRELQDEGRSLVTASEAKQSAVYLFACTKDKKIKAGCRAPLSLFNSSCHSSDGARSDASVTCHCERSEAIRSLSFCFYPRQENKSRLPRPLPVNH